MSRRWTRLPSEQDHIWNKFSHERFSWNNFFHKTASAAVEWAGLSNIALGENIEHCLIFQNADLQKILEKNRLQAKFGQKFSLNQLFPNLVSSEKSPRQTQQQNGLESLCTRAEILYAASSFMLKYRTVQCVNGLDLM